MSLKSYRDLEVWRRAMDLVESVYLLTKRFPEEERFGLTGQIRKCAVSVPANIAEGYGRIHRGDYVHHLSVANGSLMELQTHLAIAVRLKFVTQEQVAEPQDLAEQVSKMLTKLIQSLRATHPKP